MRFNHRDDIIQLTPLWKGERFPDGRPKVSDDLLNRVRKLTLEEAWAVPYTKGYEYQFQADFRMSRPEKRLIGRAVTTVFVPTRPDLNDLTLDYGHNVEGRKGAYNQWVIDSLVEDDVLVCDLFDRGKFGTYVGGNLTTAIAHRTKRGGALIWGGVRDLEQIQKIEDTQIMFRHADPTGIRDCVMTAFNGPCRIGEAICLPGDIVIGSATGVVFIPPHLAEEAVLNAEKSHIRDVFGFARIKEGVYATSQIDMQWTVPMMEDFINWVQTDPRGEDYRELTWEEEMDTARTADTSRGPTRL